MNYELAKQLKDAGFKQGWYFGATYYPYPDSNERVWDDETSANKDSDVVIIPTLEELIEACGDDFGGLQKSEFYWDTWSKTDLFKKKIKIFNTGSTPEEAVSKLWLELNK